MTRKVSTRVAFCHTKIRAVTVVRLAYLALITKCPSSVSVYFVSQIGFPADWGLQKANSDAIGSLRLGKLAHLPNAKYHSIAFRKYQKLPGTAARNRDHLRCRLVSIQGAVWFIIFLACNQIVLAHAPDERDAVPLNEGWISPRHGLR